MPLNLLWVLGNTRYPRFLFMDSRAVTLPPLSREFRGSSPTYLSLSGQHAMLTAHAITACTRAPIQTSLTERPSLHHK